MATQNITNSAGRADGTTNAGETNTINILPSWLGPSLGCWIGGPGALGSSNYTNFNVDGTLNVNFSQGSCFSIGSWSRPTQDGANIGATGVINVVGDGTVGYVYSINPDSTSNPPNGFFNIAGKTTNNGTINISDCTVYNYIPNGANGNNASTISGSGTINLTNVTLATDERGNSDCYWNATFMNVSDQTINMTNSQVSFGAKGGYGSLKNVTINCSGGGNYIAFNIGIQDNVDVKIRGFGNGDIIDFASFGKADTYKYDPSTGNLTITTKDVYNKDISITVDIGLGYDPDGFSSVPTYTGGSGTDTGIQYTGPAPCYLAGTLIETQRGWVSVETLTTADYVLAHEGAGKALRRVTWVGCTSIVDGHHPVIVRRNALGKNIPFQDLYITEEHCLFFDERFVPVRMLVNGHSIAYDTQCTSYDVYHVELEAHSVISANGALSESFLDTGHVGFQDRKTRNLNWGVDSAYPLCTDRDFVEPLFHRLAADVPVSAVSANDNSPVEKDSIALLVNEETYVTPTRRNGQTVVFHIKDPIRSLSILAETSIPSETIGPFVDDRRVLGALVGEVLMFSPKGMTRHTAHLEVPALSGWHERECSNCRWTGAQAILPDVQSEEGANTIALTLMA